MVHHAASGTLQALSWSFACHLQKTLAYVEFSNFSTNPTSDPAFDDYDEYIKPEGPISQDLLITIYLSLYERATFTGQLTSKDAAKHHDCNNAA